MFLSNRFSTGICLGWRQLSGLDAEVVNIECESCFAGGMSPECGCLGHGLVAEAFEFSDKLVKRNDAYFF